MSKLRNISKRGTLQKTRPSNGPAARSERNKPAVPSNSGGNSTFLTISQGEIADRAYSLFLARGGQPGDDWADWFRAEGELGREKALMAAETLGNG